MNKSFIICITLLFLSVGNIFPITGNAYIENAQVVGSTFSWELHYQRTDVWTAGLLSNALGGSAASFDFNIGALNSPSVVVATGCPLDNANYNVTVQIVGGKTIVDISFALNTLAGELPLNVKVKLLTVSMNITDANQTAGLSWDALNTGFFDNTDATVTTTLQGSSNTPLPVELNSFTAEVNDYNVILNWKTATEINNYGFDIERSIKVGENEEPQWVTLGFVEGNGNSNAPKSYKYTDNKPLGGSKFVYRLKQIDYDGSYEYSGQVEVELLPGEFKLYQNYPNPFNPNTTIRYQLPQDARVTLKIYDILGSEIATLIDEEQEAGYKKVQFTGTNYASGMYIYRLSSGSFSSIKKMLMVK